MGQGVRLDGDLFRCLECEHLARYRLSEQDVCAYAQASITHS
jgi:hypothetical protein